jgi:hypothetical protein
MAQILPKQKDSGKWRALQCSSPGLRSANLMTLAILLFYHAVFAAKSRPDK